VAVAGNGDAARAATMRRFFAHTASCARIDAMLALPPAALAHDAGAPQRTKDDRRDRRMSAIGCVPVELRAARPRRFAAR
jgi:hypothetical protein